MINPRALRLASVLGLSMLLSVAAVPATARDFRLRGRSDLTTDCNADARFRVTVSLAKGKFIEVKDFRTYGINYPRTSSRSGRLATSSMPWAANPVSSLAVLAVGRSAGRTQLAEERE